MRVIEGWWDCLFNKQAKFELTIVHVLPAQTMCYLARNPATVTLEDKLTRSCYVLDPSLNLA